MVKDHKKLKIAPCVNKIKTVIITVIFLHQTSIFYPNISITAIRHIKNLHKA